MLGKGFFVVELEGCLGEGNKRGRDGGLLYDSQSIVPVGVCLSVCLV